MKKRYIGLVICLAICLIIAGCSSKSKDYTATPEEIVVPEESVIPDAATAVEKIINKEDIIEISDSSLNTEEDTVVEEKPQVSATLFYVFGDYSEFQTSVDMLEEGYSADDLLGRLVIHNIVPLDCKVKNFDVVTEDDGTKTISLDLSDSFKQYLSTMSDKAEEAILASLADTFLYNYNAERINITIGGQIISTKSGDYEAAFEWAESPLKINK